MDKQQKDGDLGFGCIVCTFFGLMLILGLGEMFAGLLAMMEAHPTASKLVTAVLITAIVAHTLLKLRCREKP